MKKLMTMLCALLAVLYAGAAVAAQWNMATPYPDATFHTRNIQQFVDDVEQATDGQLSITVHSGGSLIKHPQIKRAVRTGQVQAGEVLISVLGNQDPIYAVDSIPFLASSYDQAAALWQASQPFVEQRLEQDGLMLLYVVPWPPQGLYTNRELDSVEDLDGLKFRAYNTTTARLAELTGMVPTQVEVPEVPQAFATGIVEAMITSPTTGVNTQAWDYVKNYYDIQAWLPKNMVFVNREAFEALEPAAQKAVLEAAKAAETRGWEMSKEESESMTKKLAENGINVIQPSDELQQGLKKVGEKLTQGWLESAGADGKEIIEAYRAGQ